MRFRLAPVIAACTLVAAAALAQPRRMAVLLYDGKLPEQVAMEAALRKAMEPHAEKVDLRTMHAGRAETVPFLRQTHLTRKDAPVLLLMSGAGPNARIQKRYPLEPSAAPEAAVIRVLQALKLPVPRELFAAPPPGVVVTVATDGSAAEKGALMEALGEQRVVNGTRLLGPTGVLVYRLRLPVGLRNADLRAELGGEYQLEWSDNARGPWHLLMDSGAYFGAAADAIPGRPRAVADLSGILRDIPDDLYVRIHTSGRGRNQASMGKLEVAALGPGEASGDAAWRAEATSLQKQHSGAVVAANTQGTVLSGVVMRDVVLTAAKSPYLMNGDVTVYAGATLTIEPGVEVRVPGPYGVRVMGQLLAKGTTAQPITFTAAVPRQPDDWKGVLFAALPGHPSTVCYCRFVNAMSVTLSRFEGEVDHNIFEGALTGVTLRDAGTGRVHHNRFANCARGMAIEGGAGEIIDNEWQNCQIGLAAAELPTRGALTFERNSIRGCSIAAVTYLRPPGRTVSPLTLRNNHWEGRTDRLIGGGSDAAEVRLEPRLEGAPVGIGPGWK